LHKVNNVFAQTRELIPTCGLTGAENMNGWAGGTFGEVERGSECCRGEEGQGGEEGCRVHCCNVVLKFVGEYKGEEDSMGLEYWLMYE
jgi:hypothetical protein